MRATQILFLLLWLFGIHAPPMFCANLTYDHRALVIDGKRRVLISGSIHYPRSTPEVSLYVSKFMYKHTCLFICTCIYFSFSVVFEVNMGRICCCRCGQTLFRNPKMEDLMWLRHMFSGTCMNRFEARYTFVLLCTVTMFIFLCVFPSLSLLFLHCLCEFVNLISNQACTKNIYQRLQKCMHFFTKEEMIIL